MKDIHPLLALLVVVIMAGVAESAIRKERSLALMLFRALGG
jgi:hypothetical protein